MKPQRNPAIDALRGFAVFLMIPANYSAELYAEPHPFWFRLMGSFAAPLFILLAGMMAIQNPERASTGIGHPLKRGLLIVGIGAAIDLGIWHIYPFTSWDVLYLIGFSFPLIWLFEKLPSDSVRWLLIASLFGLAPLLQQVLGYADCPTEIYLDASEQTPPPLNVINIFHHLLIDGWFPFIPWIGISFVGVMLGRLRSHPSNPLQGSIGLYTGLGLLLIGSFLWWYHPGAMLTREGYSELFYPATPGFLLFSTGFALLLLRLFEGISRTALCWPFRMLGSSSMFVYVSHQALAQYYLTQHWNQLDLNGFATLCLIVTTGFVILCRGLITIKQNWPARPLPIKILFG